MFCYDNHVNLARLAETDHHIKVCIGIPMIGKSISQTLNTLNFALVDAASRVRNFHLQCLLTAERTIAGHTLSISELFILNY